MRRTAAIVRARAWTRYARVLVLLLGAGAAVVAAAASAGAAQDAAPGHAVVLLYHHVDTGTPASTSVSPEIFAAHLEYLAANDYAVVPLSRVVAALAGRAPALPPRAVAITFDDGYRSVAEQAAPLLDRHDFPYAVFVTTDYVDRGFGNVMDWDTLRTLERGGAEIGNHSMTHTHYLHRPAGETQAEWRRRVLADMTGAQARLQEELEAPLQAIAYPYGEFDESLMALAAEAGFAGFGQQSGPASAAASQQALARFPLAGDYASVDMLAERLRTRPFRVRVIEGAERILSANADTQPPALRLRLEASDARLDALNCFVSGQPAPRVTWIDRAAGEVRIVAAQPLPVGRSKYTCTAPARSGGGSYYWYSHLWMRPPAPGEWYPD